MNRCPSCRRSLEAHHITRPLGFPSEWRVQCDLPETQHRHAWHCPRIDSTAACTYASCQTYTTYPLAPQGWYTTADIDRLMADLVETEPREVDGQEAMFGDDGLIGRAAPPEPPTIDSILATVDKIRSQPPRPIEVTRAEWDWIKERLGAELDLDGYRAAIGIPIIIEGTT